jgi:DNA-binding NarL/FixJ family response regulator
MKPNDFSSASATEAPVDSEPATRSSKRRVLIIDDHPITRQGLKALINQQLNVEVAAEADSPRTAMALLDELRPDLAVVDVSLNGDSGLELIKDMRERVPDLKVLVVSMHDEMLFAERALRAGAMGYVMKQEAGEKVAAALENLLRGDVYLSPQMKQKMLHRCVNHKKEGVVFAIDTLSEREMEVFRLIGSGYSTREIADRLKLSPKTIDSYREHLKFKLSVDSGAELVRHAIQWVRSDGKY